MRGPDCGAGRVKMLDLLAAKKIAVMNDYPWPAIGYVVLRGHPARLARRRWPTGRMAEEPASDRKAGPVPLMFLLFPSPSATLDCGREGLHGPAGFHRRF